jgi:hypothetical protein
MLTHMLDGPTDGALERWTDGVMEPHGWIPPWTGEIDQGNVKADRLKEQLGHALRCAQKLLAAPAWRASLDDVHAPSL